MNRKRKKLVTYMSWREEWVWMISWSNSKGTLLSTLMGSHALVRGMDMDDIMEQFQRGITKHFNGVQLGTNWTQPEIGEHAVKFWRNANQYEGKDKMGMAPLIQVIYVEEENQLKLKKMAMLLHCTRYGQYNKVILKSNKRSEYTENAKNKSFVLIANEVLMFILASSSQ